MVQWSHFTTGSGAVDFFWPLIVRGVGLGLVFVPLTNLALSDLPMHRIPQGTGLFNLMRQLGGSIGILLASIVTAVINAMVMPASVSLPILVVAVGVSIAVGVLAGVVPAYRGARLDPVESLRYE
jgi:hypothetical protein